MRRALCLAALVASPACNSSGSKGGGDPGLHGDLDGDSTPIACVDECLYGTTRNNSSEICTLWDDAAKAWIDVDASTSLHDRARLFAAWLGEYHLPTGALAETLFSDETLTTVSGYGGTADSAIHTGEYLAAEALRLLVTGSPEAEASVSRIVQTLHHWWRISGDRGYLARIAFPADSDPKILGHVYVGQRGHHRDFMYQGELWHWRGHISRDQYQGVMLGFSLAYDATSDPATREIIREDVIDFVEQLMVKQVRPVTIVGMPLPIDIEMEYCVFTDDETPNGQPELDLDLADYDASDIWGFQEFHPNPGEMFGIGSFPRAGSAIMLASFFKVALQVTEGVPAYATRRLAIADHYDANIASWLDVAEGWQGHAEDRCGDGYFGYNIVWLPMYNLARLETLPALRSRIRDVTLGQQLWPAVAEHKNVFFAFITAANAPAGLDGATVLAAHGEQLALFPAPPRVVVPMDLTGTYPESVDCPGLSAVATDVNQRCVDDFMWQRHPWCMVEAGNLTAVMPGADYLLAYWLGRYHGFLTDDAAGTCLRYQPQ